MLEMGNFFEINKAIFFKICVLNFWRESYTCLYESCLCRQFKFLYRLSICLHRYKFAEVQEKNQFKMTIMHFIGLLCNIMQEVQFPQNMKKLAKVNLILDQNVL